MTDAKTQIPGNHHSRIPLLLFYEGKTRRCRKCVSLPVWQGVPESNMNVRLYDVNVLARRKACAPQGSRNLDWPPFRSSMVKGEIVALWDIHYREMKCCWASCETHCWKKMALGLEQGCCLTKSAKSKRLSKFGPDHRPKKNGCACRRCTR